MALESFYKPAKLRMVSFFLAVAVLSFIATRSSDQKIALTSLFGLLAVGLTSSVGTNLLSSFVDRELDTGMKRTLERSFLPGDNLKPVLAAGMTLIAASLFFSYFIFGFAVFALVFSAVFGIVIFYNYFLKRTSSLSTLIGAVPGSFPALIGSAAGAGRITPEGIMLGGIVFFWQVPHALIIALRFREDYEKAGVPTLFSRYGDKKGMMMLKFSASSLLAYTSFLYFFGQLSAFYFAASSALGFFLLSKTFKIKKHDADSEALAKLHWLYVFYLLALFIFVALS